MFCIEKFANIRACMELHCNMLTITLLGIYICGYAVETPTVVLTRPIGVQRRGILLHFMSPTRARRTTAVLVCTRVCVVMCVLIVLERMRAVCKRVREVYLKTYQEVSR